jgi:hypothetical protein
VGSLLDPDWVETGSLAGWLGDRVVGIANYVRLRDPRLAEAAFVVATQSREGASGRACSSSSRSARPRQA